MNPVIESLVELFDRDLQKLEDEIKAYPDEALLWKAVPGTTNPGGNLALHLSGNLQNYFGAVLGNTGYKRNRPLEFSAKDVPISEVVKEIKAARAAVKKVLLDTKIEDFTKIYPEEIFGKPMTYMFFFNHLYGHLNYHLGQVNYHRRIVK
ncbi:DinB family protein [Pseudochryseolinea flava]|uniref:DinB superfamily protein n=1 Tax=Pseudochryseolinea flava TaxID=2059302 RepID=A0A364Y3A9_9BACT|nr:DinB family protein [Pseudochryseolinea flava]RAW01276.1 DinB superfamily protein [Pseudochryseolinea flava]